MEKIYDKLNELNCEDLLCLIPNYVNGQHTQYFPFLDGTGYKCDMGIIISATNFESYSFKILLIEVIIYLMNNIDSIKERYFIKKEHYCNYGLVSKHNDYSNFIQLYTFPFEKYM